MALQITQIIGPIAEGPNRLNPGNFAQKAAEFVADVEVLDTQMNNFADEANALADEAEINAQIAADSATNPRTSSTSLTIGTGNKTLVTDTGVPYYIGQVIRIIYASDGTQWMQGDITAYDSGTGDLTVNVDKTSGSGTFADWVIASTFGLSQLRQGGASVDDTPIWDGSRWVAFTPERSAFVKDGDSLTWHETSLINPLSNTYQTIFNIGTAVDLIGGAIYSSDIGFRLTVDGTVVADRTGSAQGENTAQDRYSVINVPPAKAMSSMKLEVWDNGSRPIGWRIATR